MLSLNIPHSKDLLVGSESKDDAGVYRVNDDLALVQTLDFITPVCDDPYEFGRIAACNSLSDVYAMGGVPVTAMNIVCFPDTKFSLDILQRVLEGGLSVITEAGVQLVGGHSVSDNELKYGLSVTGYVHPGKILRNNTIRAGDSLILTKPLGTGIVATALKAGLAEDKDIAAYIKSMAFLNKYAADVMSAFPVNACTDVTGFGLAGHLKEMMAGNEFSVRIDCGALPVLGGVEDYASMGLVPAGLYRNRDYAGAFCVIADSVSPLARDMLFDPQTSGGLLISLPHKEALSLVDALKNADIPAASIIGTVVKENVQAIYAV
jgi:selenide,water dikinase